MCKNPVESKTFKLKAGSRVNIDGTPYWLVSDIEVTGFEEPRFPDRPYNGQPHTCTGTRGATEIRGVTFRDLRDCFVRAVLLSTGAEVIDGVDMRPRYEEADKGEAAVLCENDLYGFSLDKLDPMAIAQNLACEVERVMGIFPNVPGLTCDAPQDGIHGA